MVAPAIAAAARPGGNGRCAPESFPSQDPGFGYGPVFVDCDQRTDQLKAQKKRKKRMPMISRVRRCASQRSSQAKSTRARTRFTRAKVKKHNRGPWKQTRPGDSDADINSQQPHAGNSRCRVQRSVDQADQKIRAVAQREPQEIRRFDILGKRRRHQRKQLPEKEHRPEQPPKPRRVFLRNHKPGCPAQPDSAADSTGGKSQSDKNARGQLQPAAKRPQGVGKDSPPQFGDCRQLLACVRNWSQPIGCHHP